MNNTKIGFIGMGLMGQPMSQRLQDAGFEVAVWNRTSDKLEQLAKKGMAVYEKLEDLIGFADILMTCVTDTQAVESIVFGENGIAVKGHSQQILIDFSSIDPEATRSMAKKLYDTKGIEWVDAPVSGGVVGAEQGTLAIMAGGRQSLIDDLAQVFAPLAKQVTRMGEIGSGQVTKICNQMLVSCNLLVMAEVMAMAEKAGVDSTQIPQALRGGFADSTPLQLTGPRMAMRDYEPVKWHVKTLLKDLDMANALAKEVGGAIPMSGLGVELMRQHASTGNVEKDPCSLIDMYTGKKA